MTPCKYCTEESLRYCSQCVAYFCSEHTCEHLDGQEYQFGTSWLSIQSVIENMDTEKLAAARLQLASQLYAIDAELFKRKFDSYRRSRPQVGLKIGDLTEPKRQRRTKRAEGSKVEKQASKIATGFKDAMASLSPETLRRVQEALRKKGF